MTQMLINHVRIDVGVRVNTATICGVAEAVTLFLFMFSQFSAFLANFLKTLEFISLFEIFFLDFLNAIKILLLEGIQLVHAHIHNILASIRVHNHLAEVWRKNVEVQLRIGGAHEPASVHDLHLLLLLKFVV